MTYRRHVDVAFPHVPIGTLIIHWYNYDHTYLEAGETCRSYVREKLVTGHEMRVDGHFDWPVTMPTKCLFVVQPHHNLFSFAERILMIARMGIDPRPFALKYFPPLSAEGVCDCG